MLPTLPGWTWKLVRQGEAVSPHLHRAIRAEGDAARAPLCAIARGAYAVDGEFPDGGWARVHAVEILSEMPPDDAGIDLCIELLHDPGVDELTEAAQRTLFRWGDAALPKVLAACETQNSDAARYLAGVLASSRTRTDEILSLLLRRFAADTECAADLAEYGDPAALPAIQAALDAYVVDGDASFLCHQAVVEMEDAIQTLGGVLTPHQIEQVERVRRRRRRAMREAGIDPDFDIDPTDPDVREAFRATLTRVLGEMATPGRPAIAPK
ncbi:MAG: hypothetical protein K8T90_16825 [Planctomycetes bacterium]|nr:hypothetical protein [Planctomycetota bacterium]